MDLNAEQKKIAVQEPKGHALLKGVAGSGKTSVGIHRTFFLLHNYCHEKDDAILLATFNRTLIAYMSDLYDRVDKKNFSEFQTLFAAPGGQGRHQDGGQLDVFVFSGLSPAAGPCARSQNTQDHQL